MKLSLYIEDESALHRLNPVSKLIGMLCLFVCAFLTDRWQLLLPVLAVVAAFFMVARARENLYRLRWLFFMIFTMTTIVWMIFGPESEDVWFSLGPLSIGKQRLHFALGMGLKLLIFVLVGALFLSVAKVEQLAYALNRIGMPYKLSFTMTLAFRLLPVFLESTLAVIDAQRCRGFDFDRGNLLQKIRNYVPVIVPVFIGALRRADGMAMALESRGFQSGHERTQYEHYESGSNDVVGIIALATIMLLYVFLWQQGLTAF